MSEPTWASEEELRSEFQGRTPLTPDAKLIADVREALGEDVNSTLDALNALWGHGLSSESSGTMDAPTGHFFRVEHWIVTTDSQGFSEVETFGSIGDAMREFQRRDAEYAEWDDDDE